MSTFATIIVCYFLSSPLTLTAVNADCGAFPSSTSSSANCAATGFALQSNVKEFQKQLNDFKTSSLAKLAPSCSSTADVAALQATLNSLTSRMTGLAASVAAISPPAQVAGKMPQSCSDLKSMGYLVNGFYTLQNKANGRIQTTFCDFTKVASNYDTVIGINDVKTTNVYFYARLANSIKVARRGYLQLLKFDVIATNVGGAFDGTKFIAPVNGAYQFMFNALAFQNISGGAVISNFRINARLQINGKDKDGLSVYSAVDPAKFPEYSSHDHGGLHNIVLLNKSDTVAISIANDLYANVYPDVSFVHFTGMLLDQILF